MMDFATHHEELTNAVAEVVDIVAELRRILAGCVRELCETGDLPPEEAKRLLGKLGLDLLPQAAAEEAAWGDSPAHGEESSAHDVGGTRRESGRGRRRGGIPSGERHAGGFEE